MNKSTIKGKLFNNKIFRGFKNHKPQPWKSYGLFVLFNSSLLVFNIAINSNAKAVAQEEITGERDLIYSYVQLDEQELLSDGAITATNSSNIAVSLLPVNVKLQGYEQQLQNIISQGLKPQTLALAISNPKGETAIVVSDGQQLPQQQINSIAKLDTQIQQSSISSLPGQWSQVIGSMFGQAQQKGQPVYISHQLLLIGNLLLGMVLLCCMYLIWQQHLKTRGEQLTLQNPKLVFPETENSEFDEINNQLPRNLITEIEQNTIPEKPKNSNVSQRRRLQIGNAIVWLVGLSSIFLRLLTVILSIFKKFTIKQIPETIIFN